jgi:hypothetical protein
MRRFVMLPAVLLALAILWPAPIDAQTETSVTAAGAGTFPAGTSYLGVPLNTLSLGMGLTMAGNWAVGQFQTSLSGVSDLGVEQTIEVEGIVSSSVPVGPGSAIFSGSCTVEAGDGTPPVPGVPFTVAISTNADGTASLRLTLGSTNLPAATMNEGSMTIR